MGKSHATEDGDEPSGEHTDGGTQSALAGKLQGLGLGKPDGVEDDEELLDEVEAKKSLEDNCDDEREHQFRSDSNVFLAYENMHAACLGLHGIDIFLGKSRFTVITQGLDLMDIFPKPPSMTSVFKRCSEIELELNEKKKKVKRKVAIF